MNDRLSAPEPRKTLPQPLTEIELAAFKDVADVLCGRGGEGVAPSKLEGFDTLLSLALAVRVDAFSDVMGTLTKVHRDRDLPSALRRLHDDDAPAFRELSNVVAGAFLMHPEVRDLIGYPGQRRIPVRIDEMAADLGDGILDPVMERGPIFRPDH